ncbi:uncharacterized protein [Nicotiana sylvestris]|uniref:uncharacterized protein n=1 Tax=Nicotiana sylvestris TaxID=4096 RepID=UPI00388C77B7
MANTACVAKYFKDKIINQPNIKLRKVQDLIRIKYGVYVGKSIYARGKHQVMGQYLGDYKQEFARIYDYADMLRSTDPGSTVVVKTSKETIPGKKVFVGIYICLHACKVGWLEGYRNVIGFDGAFLKSVCKGELLSCIGKDGNNHMYPIAWAVVEKETKHTWSWFFRYLMHDLQLTESQGEGLTIISDMQKRLVAFASELLPNAEHRMHKSIITMLEEIRVKVMGRMTTMREFATRKEIYLKAFSYYIQPVTNMDIWPSTQNPTVEPPVIIKMPGRPKKNRKRAQDEPKKKFYKRSRKGTLMTCSNCKTVGHNKKGCPILKGQGSGTTGTSNTGATQPSQAAQTTIQQSGPTSSGAAKTRNTQPSTVASLVLEEGQEVVDFEEDQELLDLCGSRDRVHSTPTKVVGVGQTNIDLGYSAPGLRWQGRNAISQRQLNNS